MSSGAMLLIAVFGLLGFLVGLLTGMVPGLHLNNVVLILLAGQDALCAFAALIVSSALAADMALAMASFIVALAVTHSFITFIPSSFLGAPDEKTSLSVLPAHRMVLEGRGYEAVRLSAIGGLAGLLISLSLIGAVKMVMGEPLNLYSGAIQGSVAFILVAIVAMLVMDERPKGRGSEVVIKGIVVKGGTEPSISIDEAIAEGKGTARISGAVVKSSGEKELWLRGGTGEMRVVLEFGSMPDIGASITIMGKLGRRRSGRAWHWQRAKAMCAFLAAGALGAALLVPENAASLTCTFLPTGLVDSGAVILLPLFAGLFGLPTLITSIKGCARIPPQSTKKVKGMGNGGKLRSSVSGALAGCMTGWLPGVSSAAATVVSRGRKGKGSPESYIVAMSAVNAANVIFNLIALFVIGKARSGAMKAVSDVMYPNIEGWASVFSVPEALLALLAVALAAGALSFAALLIVGRRAAKLMPRIPYRVLALCAIGFIIAMVSVFSGTLGLAILPTATLVGFLPHRLGVKKAHLMGALIVPTILFFVL
ncbi:MAG: tripartite tricarboxylate transporter permease [Euryarchaeota archaeon]|nr:tripartite tricarboxylate transporter permease [Euryarchaeota archaeon]